MLQIDRHCILDVSDARHGQESSCFVNDTDTVRSASCCSRSSDLSVQTETLLACLSKSQFNLDIISVWTQSWSNVCWCAFACQNCWISNPVVCLNSVSHMSLICEANMPQEQSTAPRTTSQLSSTTTGSTGIHCRFHICIYACPSHPLQHIIWYEWWNS